MPVCPMCRKTSESDDCPNGCKHPDYLIEEKFNKHGGKAPVKDRAGTLIGDPDAPYKWPTFKKGTKRPGAPDAGSTR